MWRAEIGLLAHDSANSDENCNTFSDTYNRRFARPRAQWKLLHNGSPILRSMLGQVDANPKDRRRKGASNERSLQSDHLEQL
jgi:hypothetical protein